jgi:hypothetical protein
MRLIKRAIMAYRLRRACRYGWRHAWIKTEFLDRGLA